MVLGLRVTRGPDWPYGDQDGGRNHVGTVVSVNNNFNVTVLWDMGSLTQCRVGENGKHDILVLDNRTIGVSHPGVECVRCENGAIVGTLWKCTVCKSANLCTPCYYSDGHLPTHPFSRVDFPGAEPVTQPKRTISQRARALGIYQHAEVTRGADWAYADQDGGFGKRGKIEEVTFSGKGLACRLTVKVKWGNGNPGAYRLGKDGKVDLTCVEEAPGPDFYTEHLAHVDVPGLSRALQAQQEQQKGPAHTFRVGDKVCVAVSTSELKQLQKGRGFTRQLTGEVGVVKKLESGGNVVASFGGETFTIAAAALKKLADYKTGDYVKVVDSRDKVHMLQTTRGGWTESMSQAIGKVGKVTMVDEDGDVVVNFGGKKHVFHPACLEPNTEETKATPGASSETPRRVITKPVPPPKPTPTPQGAEGGHPRASQAYDLGSDEVKGDDYYHKDSKKSTEEKPDFSSSFDGLAMLKALIQGNQNMKDDFLKAVIEGKDYTVKQLLTVDRSLAKLQLKTIPCVSLAAQRGHANVIGVLADAGADVNVKDQNGNTPLLVALSEQKGDAVRVLLEKGANANTTGQKKLSPLHLAVHKNMIAHIRLLLKNGANPNIQDEYGDTPLHDAVITKNDAAADILIENPRLNVWMTNNKQFTTLAFACLKQHNRTVDMLLSREPGLANAQMEGDGYYPLHICAVNNHVPEARLIFTKGRVNVNCKNVKLLTPLHLATMCAHADMVKLLLDNNADVSLKDADGDTPLHLCVKGRSNTNVNDALMMLLGLQDDDGAAVKLAMARLLIDKGANVDVPNNDGVTPITCCTHIRLRELIRQHANERDAKGRAGQVLASGNVGTASAVNQTQKCAGCSVKIADTCFLPCQHQYVCVGCVQNYRRCPVCRRDVDQFLNLRKKQGLTADDIDCKVQ